MTKRDLKTLKKAHSILERHTTTEPVQDLRIFHSMQEAHDGMSALLFTLERRPLRLQNTITALRHRAAAAYNKYILGL